MNKAVDNKTKIQKSILNKYLNRIENEYFKDIHEKYSVYQKIFNSNYKDQNKIDLNLDLILIVHRLLIIYFRFLRILHPLI